MKVLKYFAAFIGFLVIIFILYALSTHKTVEIKISNKSDKAAMVYVELYYLDTTTRHTEDLLKGSEILPGESIVGSYNMIDSYNGDSCEKYIVKFKNSSEEKEYDCSLEEIVITD